MMELMRALLRHVVLVMQLNHDGSGLPTQFSGAFLLSALYSALIFANSTHFSDEILGLGFIVLIYLFVLRMQVIGLIVLIGIISSTISFALGWFGSLSVLQLVMLNIMEYVMVLGVLINTIKRHASIT